MAVMEVEYSGAWCTAGSGCDRTAQLFPGERESAEAAADGETPSVWSLDQTGTLKGWHLRPRDAEYKFIREVVLVQRRIQFSKKHDVILDAIAHKITFVTYSQGGLKVSRDMGSREAEPQSTPLKRSSRCVSAALTPNAKYAVGGARDGSVSLWCCETGDLLRCFSPDSSAGPESAGDCLATSEAAFSEATRRDATTACGAPAAQPNAHDDWVTCVAVAEANNEQRAANPGVDYIVVTVAFDSSLKTWGVGVPTLRAGLSVSPATDLAQTTARSTSVSSSTPNANAEVHVTLLHQSVDPCGRIDSVVLSPDCSTLTVAMMTKSQKMLMSYDVAANGVLELNTSECIWSPSLRHARMTLQLGPMGQSLLVQTIRSTPCVSVEFETFDARTLHPQPNVFTDPKKTGNAVLGAARTIHMAPSDGGFIQNYTTTFEL